MGILGFLGVRTLGVRTDVAQGVRRKVLLLSTRLSVEKGLEAVHQSM